MAQSGVFSGLKFADIAFPAAATIASAYNPYIGYGLQTGMNLFNTAAGFQDNLRRWKHIKEQQELEDQRMDEFDRGITEHLGFLGDISNYEADRYKRDLTGKSNEQLNTATAAAAAMPTAGGFNPWQALQATGAQYTDLPGAQEEIQGRYDETLLGDPGYRAARTQEETLRLAQSGMRLSPGSAMQTAGILGEQAHGAARELARIKAVQKSNEEQARLKFMLGQAEKAGTLDMYEKQRDKDLQVKLEGLAAWEEIETRLRDNADNPKKIPFEELVAMQSRLGEGIGKLRLTVDQETDPEGTATLRAMESTHNFLSQLVEAQKAEILNPDRPGGDGSGVAGRVTGTVTGKTPEEQYEESQRRMQFINSGKTWGVQTWGSPENVALLTND